MRIGHRSSHVDVTEAADAIELLRRHGSTLATAESLTGGRLAAMLTGVPGASAAYLGGVVSYATDLKVEILGVSPAVVERYGVVSAECAREMAAGVSRLTGATYALSTTGVAGPDEQEGKPVGTVYVGLAGPGREGVVALELVGDRASIQDRTCREALRTLVADLRGEEPRLG